jgi:hypothetical protein
LANSRRTGGTFYTFGQYSAVHPNLLYRDDFVKVGEYRRVSMRLFWQVMAKVYPGVFNGSEKLNAIELTKRMAWGYGGVVNLWELRLIEMNLLGAIALIMRV